MSKQVGRYLLVGSTMILVVLAGCARQPHPHGADLPGFFYGVLHGFLMPFSLIMSLFRDVRIYAFPNAGKLYDFGFAIGALMIFGGSGGAARKK